jgi:GNAT superfamily N-acetyltransferase
MGVSMAMSDIQRQDEIVGSKLRLDLIGINEALKIIARPFGNLVSKDLYREKKSPEDVVGHYLQGEGYVIAARKGKDYVGFSVLQQKENGVVVHAVTAIAEEYQGNGIGKELASYRREVADSMGDIVFAKVSGEAGFKHLRESGYEHPELGNSSLSPELLANVYGEEIDKNLTIPREGFYKGFVPPQETDDKQLKKIIGVIGEERLAVMYRLVDHDPILDPNHPFGKMTEYSPDMFPQDQGFLQPEPLLADQENSDNLKF